MNSIKNLDDFLQLKTPMPFERNGKTLNYYFESFNDYKNFDFNNLLQYKDAEQKAEEIKIYSLCLHIEELYKKIPELVAFNIVSNNDDDDNIHLGISTCDSRGNINYNWDDIKYRLNPLLEFIDESVIDLFENKFVISDRKERFSAYQKITQGFDAQNSFLEFIEHNKIPENMSEDKGLFYKSIFSGQYPVFPSKPLEKNFKYYDLMEYKVEKNINFIEHAFQILQISGYIALLNEFFVSLNKEESLSISLHHNENSLAITYDVKDDKGNSVDSDKNTYYKQCLDMINKNYLPEMGSNTLHLLFKKDYFSEFEIANKENRTLLDTYSETGDLYFSEMTRIYSNKYKTLKFNYNAGDVDNFICFSAGLIKTVYCDQDGIILDNTGDDIVLELMNIYKSIIQKNIILSNVKIDDNENNKKFKRL